MYKYPAASTKDSSMAAEATSQARRSLRLIISARVVSKFIALEIALSIFGDVVLFPNISSIH
jgi:hypothetical protein